MAIVKRIHHIAIVVPAMDGALDFWQDILGLQLKGMEEVPSQKSMVAFLPVGDSEIELVKPLTADSGLEKFLNEKGPGMHHLCLEVDDLEGMLADLKRKGVRLINDIPQILPGRKMAFIHPKAANGVLVELYEIIP
jgi:methylmalonyl-CoA/ethylmalonyl-CoA epimerase